MRLRLRCGRHGANGLGCAKLAGHKGKHPFTVECHCIGAGCGGPVRRMRAAVEQARAAEKR